jgi:hypothetical protein
MGTASGEDRQGIETVRDLAAVAQIDTLYRDLFLQRATAKLRAIFPEKAYRDAGDLEPRVAVLLAESRRAVDRQEWSKVKDIGAQVTQLRAELEATAPKIEVARSVYDGAAVAIDPLCVELQPLLKDQMTVNAARQIALDSFGRLTASDPEWADFHRRRRTFFEEIQAVRTDTKAPAKKVTSVAQLRQEAHAAAAAGDVTRLQTLADEILAAEAAGSAAEKGAPGASAAAVAVPEEIQQPFDAAAVEKARALGFAHVEIRPQSAATAQKIAEFARTHQWRTSGSAAETAREGAVRLNELMREVEVPADMTEPASTVILMFAINPFINSGGARYLVHFGSECVLVEDFPETGEPPQSELIKALQLPGRKALARVEIERALRENGASILQERLGLDPKEYRLVCLPYDVYLRAGRDLGWGQQQGWTHVDGYQLGRGTRLRALVAGDVRHGGLYDLCAIGADDGRDAVTARFAVVRRARMAIGRA